MTKTTLISIRSLSLNELKKILLEKGEKPFRAKQIYEWIWKKSAISFDEMTNLSVDFRSWLKQHFVFHAIQLDKKQISQDGTIKCSFTLHDQHKIEGVLIPTEERDRMTACVSSQVGCSLTCKFCATGYMERKRNLEPAEIYDQVVQIKKLAEEHYQIPLSNIVFMGMGEPLLNYANVMQSIYYITSPDGLHMSPSRITVSTAGIAKMILKLGDEEVKFNLALSLHAANDEKRSVMMPINESNSLEELSKALKHFYEKTQSIVTYEYIVFYDFNDTLQDAEELYQFTKHVPCKINIIEYNPIEESSFKNTSEDRLEKFGRYLEKKGVRVVVRRSRGKDIDAACGQLAGKDKTT